jgi:phosphoglycolate phosphatase
MPARFPPTRGVIFDLDGTLVDSGLDFAAMRREMGIDPGRPILETIDAMDDERAARCREILARHEWAGATSARLMPGVREFLAALAARDIHRAVLTRNGREVALSTLHRLELDFDTVFAREDAPVKPNPAAIWRICEKWQLPASEVALVGDFRFDIEAGRRAGVRTVLYTVEGEPSVARGAAEADFCFRSFREPESLLRWLAEPL